MGLIIRYIFIIMFLFFYIAESQATWQAPVEIITGAWGNDVKQFGLESGDSGDNFPLIEAITPNNEIIITDISNKKQLVFSLSGNFVKEVKWAIKSQSGGITYYDIPEYSFGAVVGYSYNGNIYLGANGKYSLKSPTGELLQTYDSIPLELGVVKSSRKQTDGSNRTVIEYNDVIYSINPPQMLEYFMRDMNGYLYGIIKTGQGGNMYYRVYKYNKCGKELAFVNMPQNIKIIEPETIPPAPVPEVTILEEYGSPVLALNGDVYTWKRTPDKYSIIKWTWQDDPNAPANVPDAPTKLAVVSSAAALTLTWEASLQDPGCVAEYEIWRSIASGEGYSSIGTVDKRTLKYEDTTAEAGTTYYYKVRARGGDGYSDYTVEASGVRPISQ